MIHTHLNMTKTHLHKDKVMHEIHQVEAHIMVNINQMLDSLELHHQLLVSSVQTDLVHKMKSIESLIMRFREAQ